MSVESDRLSGSGIHAVPSRGEGLASSWPHLRRRPHPLRDRVMPPATPPGRDPDVPPGPELPGLGIPEGIHFHVLSFEGPDPYARIGGLETRVAGICEALVAEGLETHLWFVGDPARPPEEEYHGLHLHRWCQWLSRYHPIGAYDGENSKVPDYAASLPPHLMARHLVPHLRRGGCAVVLAEEWQTVDAVLHLDHLLRARQLRHRVRILWNANNVFGFDRVDWPRLRDAAVVTTVSRYMKQILRGLGVEAIAIPNGLGPQAYLPPDRAAVAQLRRSFAGRTALTKIARWDPDKRWLGSVAIVARLRELGMKPLLVARGGREPYGAEVLRAMRRSGLSVVERGNATGDLSGLVQALSDVDGADVVHLVSHVSPEGLRALFRASDVVLANSTHEPFGLVGLEAMAAGGVVCTGLTGEVYAMPGLNALAIQTGDDAQEFVGLWRRVQADKRYEAALRRAGRAMARNFAWPEVIRTNLAPRLDLPHAQCRAEC
jgi:glycosyltransferase involved in cell wall biosynthesis